MFRFSTLDLLRNLFDKEKINPEHETVMNNKKKIVRKGRLALRFLYFVYTSFHQTTNLNRVHKSNKKNVWENVMTE